MSITNLLLGSNDEDEGNADPSYREFTITSLTLRAMRDHEWRQAEDVPSPLDPDQVAGALRRLHYDGVLESRKMDPQPSKRGVQYEYKLRDGEDASDLVQPRY